MNLADLQKKTWYRFIKVIFILVLLISFSAAALRVLNRYEVYNAFDSSQSMIYCQLGNKKSFTFEALGIMTRDIRPNPIRHQIQEACDIEVNELLAQVSPSQKINVFTNRPENCPWGCSMSNAFIEAGFTDEQINELPKGRYLEYGGVPIVQVEHQYKPSRDWSSIVLSLFAYSILLWIAAEAARRAVYYIFLGKLIPTKNLRFG